MTSTLVGVSPTAKMVSAVKRALTVTGTTLSYQLDMAAVGQELNIHLEAQLEKEVRWFLIPRKSEAIPDRAEVVWPMRPKPVDGRLASTKQHTTIFTVCPA